MAQWLRYWIIPVALVSQRLWRICLPVRIMGAWNPRGQYAELMVHKIPRRVRGLSCGTIQNWKVSDSMHQSMPFSKALKKNKSTQSQNGTQKCYVLSLANALFGGAVFLLHEASYRLADVNTVTKVKKKSVEFPSAQDHKRMCEKRRQKPYKTWECERGFPLPSLSCFELEVDDLSLKSD